MIQRLFQLAAFVAIGASLASAAPKPKPDINYVPLNVRWMQNDQVKNVQFVFPHPQAANRVYLATNDGLLRSIDRGRTFSPVPAAASDKIGVISDIAFQADDADHLIFATRDRGLWTSSDGGDTVTQLAIKANGLASDSIQNVFFASDDSLQRTLIAIHGAEAPGLSRSTDNGKTWTILFPDQHVYHLFYIIGKQLLLDAASDKDPDARKVYYLASLQEPWQKLLDDVFVTGAATPDAQKESNIILATADKGMFKIAREGGIIKNIDPAGEMEWASLDSTWGHNPTTRLTFAYQPKKLGMVVFTPEQLLGSDEQATPFRTMSDGLFTGPLVMDGAHIRASADGTTFYAVVNRAFYRSEPVGGAFSLTNVTLTPASVLPEAEKMKAAQKSLADDLVTFTANHRVAEAAKEIRPRLDANLKLWNAQRVVITAEVRSPTADPVDRVKVDLRRFKLSAESLLYDDGQHDDGKAGDGVYGNHFSVDFTQVKPNNAETGLKGPETVPLPLTAITKSNQVAGAVGTLTLSARQEAIPFNPGSEPRKVVGDVEGGNVRLPNRGYIHTVNVKSPGEWAAMFVSGYDNRSIDITSQAVMSFWIKSTVETSEEISITLRDSPRYSRPETSQPVNLIAEGFVPGKKIGTTDVRVEIPVSRLIENAGDFQPSITGAFTLKSKTDKPIMFMIHDIRFLPVANPKLEDTMGDE